LTQIAQDQYVRIITIFEAIEAVADKSPDLAIALAELGRYVAEISHGDLVQIRSQINRSSMEIN
jgi:hypothetical protein